MDEQLSYPEDGNARCLAIEDSSFWFRHRNRCIVAAVSRYRPAGRSSTSAAAMGLFDVPEHIERDDEMLLTLFNLLRRGGWLYLTVPAHQFLFSASPHRHDLSAER